MSASDLLSRHELIPFVLSALAITMGVFYATIRSFLRHRERMAMIRMGMHPDGDGTQVAEPAKNMKAKSAKEAAWSEWSPPSN